MNPVKLAWLLIGWSIIATVFYLSVLAPYRAPNLGDFSHQDKIYHFIAYFGLMLWFAQLYPRQWRWIIALSLFCFGIAIEFIQPFTGRDFDLLDMLANGSGIITGWAITLLKGDFVYRRWFANQANR
ncbi:hypothetical protein THMIRHAS_21190 [Thiosulfatimonas sediminis]|uniref:VanZ-like domain-containing protein n=1 Tax=Thiosulfatimonas sediminis TaxID=2675054 RepID=A0A6F8PXC4_9GAMM|nr:VanZ family protein [Thiosulfatimonas sediminis]BBP46746.1 hypothetical protein THMIRHAS_21190 [Thiosulfatimonas sediminis]